MDGRGSKRPVQGPPVPDWAWLTRSATREEVVEGLATLLPRDICERVSSH